MNQIMRVGDGVILAIDREVRPDEFEHIGKSWREAFPGIRVFVAGNTQIIEQGDGGILFEFTGDVTPTFVAEFKRWWESLTSPSTVGGA